MVTVLVNYSYTFRVYKSFLIASEKISVIDGYRFFLKNVPLEIPLGDVYKSTFLELMKKKMM
ncbi:hypothetical protein B0O44_103446 [Pedobacter nutrimenti]|uniref:LytTr DNA-binding domain-containing protein n=1 Tax=Pedobacter nutrimenti TaxID=1241337 RepID=A0A318UHI0_9SPHI|nr:hypothetical protein B0O44_103446 [Pedobacter nutrimenti]